MKQYRSVDDRYFFESSIIGYHHWSYGKGKRRHSGWDMITASGTYTVSADSLDAFLEFIDIPYEITIEEV